MLEFSRAAPVSAIGPVIGRQRLFLLTLTLTCSLGMLSSTIYVPSIPAIARALDTSVASVQMTFVGYLLAFAGSMLALGPLSDRYGRKQAMICGIALGALGSLCSAVSPNVGWLIAARILQGVGFSAGLVVGRATIRDLYGRDGAAQIIAGIAIAMTLIQSFAPIPGGYLQAWVGWRANFAAVAAITGLALVLIAYHMPNTSPVIQGPREAVSALVKMMLAGYRTLARTRRFMAYALTATGAHAGFHIFAAGAPAVLISGFGVSPEDYGFYASLPPIGFIVGSFLSNRMTRRLGIDALIGIGSAVMIPAGLIMLCLALLHVASPFAIVGPMIVICCGSGLITPNAVAGSLGVNAGVVGTASGLVSFVQMSGAAALTAALSLGGSGNSRVLALVIAFAGLLAVSAFASLTQLGRLPARASI
jgi:MFS transporter, DHA1 family, multidrug resistance protein